MVWIGNNDSSLAALGAGGSNPHFQPVPLDQIESELDPILAGLPRFGEVTGGLSFEPYSLASIERNLTLWEEFLQKYIAVLDRFLKGSTGSSSSLECWQGQGPM